MSSTSPSNAAIADLLERIGDLLESQGADPYRVRAYRMATTMVSHHHGPIHEIAHDPGVLEELPTIGKSIAATIRQFVEEGRSAMLDRLEGQVCPEDQFTRIPGIGEALASRIHHELGVESLADLELAAHDGRLTAMHGVGERRALAVQNAIAAILGPRSMANRGSEPEEPQAGQVYEPPVSTLLAIDEIYRRDAAAGKLRKVTPRRFNPEGSAWLPIMHRDRDGWHFTALFSNTARAHQLGKTGDWVILFYEAEGESGQATIVTETNGPAKGDRVVRGREEECIQYLNLT